MRVLRDIGVRAGAAVLLIAGPLVPIASCGDGGRTTAPASAAGAEAQSAGERPAGESPAARTGPEAGAERPQAPTPPPAIVLEAAAIPAALHALVLAGRWEEALPHCEAGVERYPPNSYYHYCRILSLLSLGRDDEARAAVRRQLRDWPLGAVYNLGVLATNFGDLRWARTIHDACAERLRPGDPFCRSRLVEALVMQGRVDEAAGRVRGWLGRGTPGDEMSAVRTALWLGVVLAHHRDRLAARLGEPHRAWWLREQQEGPSPLHAQLPELLTPAGTADLPLAWNVAWVTVPARLNGERDVRLMVDTGSNHLSISPRLAEELGCEPLGPVEVGGAGGTGAAESRLVRVRELALGGIRLRDVPAVLSDPEEDLEGILGTALLADFYVDLDLPALRLRLAPGSRPLDQVAPPLRPGTTGVGFLWEHGLILLGGSINRLYPGWFLLDTGANVSLVNRRHLEILLRTAEVRRAPLRPGEAALRSRGVGGTSPIDRLAPLSVVLGNVHLRHQDVFVAEFPFERNVWITSAVGMQMLQDLRIVIDYGRRVVYLTPNVEHVPEEYRRLTGPYFAQPDLGHRLGNPELPQTLDRPS